MYGQQLLASSRKGNKCKSQDCISTIVRLLWLSFIQYRITESQKQNAEIGRDLTDHPLSSSLPWEGTSFTGPGCSGTYITWPYLKILHPFLTRIFQNIPSSLTPQGNFNEISNRILTRFLLYLLDGCMLKQQNIDLLRWAVILSREDPLVKTWNANMIRSCFRTIVVFLKVCVAEQFTLLETGGRWHSQFSYLSLCDITLNWKRS